MPPGYKPLPVDLAEFQYGNLAPSKPIAFSDFERAEAARLAQQLNNQAVQISNQSRQRAADREIAQADAISAAYQQNPDQFGEEQALDLAKRIALQQGDLGSAIEIERAQRARKGGEDAYSPEMASMLAKELGVESLPAGASPKFVNDILDARRNKLYGQSIDVQRELIRNKDERYNNQIQSFAPGDWESDINPETGQGPSREDGKKFTATIAAHRKINSNLALLEASLLNGGGNDPTDPEFVRQRQLIANLQVAFKEKNNFGAALTANEQAINDAQLPRILARTDVGVGTALVEAGLGRDPIDAIRNLRQILDGEVRAQARTYKFRRSGSPRMDIILDDPGAIAQQYGMPASMSAPTPASGGALSGGQIPRKADGSPLSREEFMALRGGK